MRGNSKNLFCFFEKIKRFKVRDSLGSLRIWKHFVEKDWKNLLVLVITLLLKLNVALLFNKRQAIYKQSVTVENCVLALP
jgi:hypothetical protein